MLRATWSSPRPPQRPHFSWYHQPFPWRKTHLPLHCTASPPECHPYRLTAASELRSGGGGGGGGASYPTSGVFPQAPPRQAQLRARRNPGVPGGFSFGGKAKTREGSWQRSHLLLAAHKVTTGGTLGQGKKETNRPVPWSVKTGQRESRTFHETLNSLRKLSLSPQCVQEVRRFQLSGKNVSGGAVHSREENCHVKLLQILRLEHKNVIDVDEKGAACQPRRGQHGGLYRLRDRKLPHRMG